jgi:hypothetical protein
MDLFTVKHTIMQTVKQVSKNTFDVTNSITLTDEELETLTVFFTKKCKDSDNYEWDDEYVKKGTIKWTICEKLADKNLLREYSDDPYYLTYNVTELGKEIYNQIKIK